jgi:DNA-directed RNA polymerase subunit A"
MEIYLDAENNTKEKAREIASEIKESKLSHITLEESIDLTNLRVEILLDQEQMKNLNIEKNELDKLIKKSMKNVNVKIEKNKVIMEPKKAEYFIKDLQSIRIKTRDIHIKGIKGIEQMIVEKEEDKWVIRTSGCNLKRVLKINGVDGSKTCTNNIHEVSKVLGIEAARNAIIKEALTTMKEQGVDTDIRHLLLVANAMTSTGEIKAIGRYGIAGSKSSVLSRANFEETIKHLTTAAVRGETDHLESVIESIIVGNLAPVGTGMVKLKMKKVVKKKALEKGSSKKEKAKKVKK